MKVKIFPIKQRAKNRVREHGDVMWVCHEGTFNGVPAILCESIEETCTGRTGRRQPWLGWLDKDECSWEILTD